MPVDLVGMVGCLNPLSSRGLRRFVLFLPGSEAEAMLPKHNMIAAER